MSFKDWLLGIPAESPEPEAPKRIVRLQAIAPGGKRDLTFEGLLVGVVDTLGGPHYVLERPRVLDSADSVEEAPRGTVYEVPVASVFFREILAEDAQL